MTFACLAGLQQQKHILLVWRSSAASHYATSLYQQVTALQGPYPEMLCSLITTVFKGHSLSLVNYEKILLICHQNHENILKNLCSFNETLLKVVRMQAKVFHNMVPDLLIKINLIHSKTKTKGKIIMMTKFSCFLLADFMFNQ